MREADALAQYEIDSRKEPLNFESAMRNDVIERTLRNAKNLLMCRRNEIPYDRQRGLDPGIFDIPMAQAQALIIQELDRVMLWEPDAEVVEGWLEQDENGETVVHCIIEITIGEQGEAKKAWITPNCTI